MRALPSLLALSASAGLALVAVGCFTPTSTIPPSEGNGGGANGCASCGTHHTIAGNANGNGGTVNGGSSGGGTPGSSSSGGTPSSSGGGDSSGGGSSSGSAGGGSSSGGGTTGAAVMCGASGGGIAGTNMIFNCTNVPYYDGDAGSCTSDWLGSQVIDFDSCSPICGASVDAVNPSGIPINGTTEFTDPATGTFHFCLPMPNLTYETQVTAAGYKTFVYGEINGQLAINMPQFGMLSTNTLDAFSFAVPGNIDMNDGALVAFIFPEDNCGGADAEANWVMSLTDENGNPYPDGGYLTLYVDEAGFPQPGASTSSYGVGIIYNIDPNVATFPTLVATPPPGSPCTVINTALGFTGRIQVGPGVFSEQGIFIE